MQATQLIERLGLIPHPEGGWYREIHRSASRVGTSKGQRDALTSIYYLLEPTQLSRWHVVDADEIWHHYAGAPLELLAYEPEARRLTRHRLGAVVEGLAPVGVVAAGVWQAARPLGGVALLGCSVAPGFEFTGFRFIADLEGHAAHFEEAMSELRPLL